MMDDNRSAQGARLLPQPQQGMGGVNPIGDADGIGVPEETIAARLQLLSSLLHDFFSERDIETVSIPEFQKQLFQQSGGFLIAEEATLLRAIASSFPSNTRFIELGSGIGLLPVALANLGYAAAGGIEADPKRHALAFDILQFLRTRNFPGAERVTLASQIIPRGVEVDADDRTIALVSNVVVSPRNVDYNGWFDFLTSFPAAIVNLGRFLERRTAVDAQERLSADLQATGFVPRQTVSEHPTTAARYVLFENVPYREHRSLRLALSEGNAEKLAPLLRSPHVAIRARAEEALRDERHLELKRQILRQRLKGGSSLHGESLLADRSGFFYIEADWVVAEVAPAPHTDPANIFYVEIDDAIIGTLTKTVDDQISTKRRLQLPVKYCDNIEHRVAVLVEGPVCAYLPTADRNRHALLKRQYQGRIEAVGNGGISGWVVNSVDPAVPSELRLYDGPQYVARFFPQTRRADVDQLLGASGLCGFVIPIPPAMRDQRRHHVRVLVGSDELTGADGPRLFATFDAGDRVADANRYIGRVERIDSSEVRGWARDLLSEAPVHVRIDVDGQTLWVLRAAAYRNRALGDESRGYHGFALRFPVSLMNGRKRKIAACIVEGDAKLESRLSDEVEFPLIALPGKNGVNNEPVFHPVATAPAPAREGRDPGVAASATDVSVIVLNWNGADMLRDLLGSLADFAPRGTEIVVVDHASTDHSREVIASYRGRLSLNPVYRKANFSFSDSNNLGAQHARGDYLLFANNDIVLVDDCISRMREVLDRRPEVGIVGLRLKEPEYHGGNQWGLRDHHLGVAFVPRLGANARYVNEPVELAEPGRAALLEGDPALAATVAVTAAFAMLRKTDFMAVGGFPPDYFYGYEDVDLCLTLEKQLARKAVCLLDGWAIHNRSATRERKHRPSEPAVVPYDERARASNPVVLQKRWGPVIHYRSLREAIADTVTWHADPLRLTFAVTTADPDAAADDYLAAMELGTALRDAFGWEITLAAAGQRDMARSDIVVFLRHDLVPSDIIGLNPGALLVAWIGSEIDEWVGSGVLAKIHLVCCASQKAVKAVHDATGRQAFWLPHAADPERFRPLPPVLRYCADVAFTGDLLAAQPPAIATLAADAERFSLAVYGEGWSEQPKWGPFARGEVPYYELPELYASTKLVVEEAGPAARASNILSARVFEALSAGALVLTNSVGGAAEIFGADLPTFSTGDELRRLVAHHLDDDAKRNALASSLRERVVADHSYRTRAQTLKRAILSALDKSLRIAIKIAVPRVEEKGRWGDFFLAEGLRQALERQGCYARIDIMPEWKAGITAGDDVVIAIRGPAACELPPGPLTLLWLISHPDTISLAELERYDHVFVASEPFAEKLGQRLGSRVSTLLQCADPQLFRPDMECELHDQVIFVGNTRGERQRTMVTWAMQADLDFRVFGAGWDSLIPNDKYAGLFIPNEQLGGYYGNGNIILCDHWHDMAAEGFLSNRIFDAAAAGANIICDPVAGVEAIFGELVTVCRSADELRDTVARIGSDVESGRGDRLRELILAKHSFDHRAAEIIRVARAALGTCSARGHETLRTGSLGAG